MEQPSTNNNLEDGSAIILITLGVGAFVLLLITCSKLLGGKENEKEENSEVSNGDTKSSSAKSTTKKPHKNLGKAVKKTFNFTHPLLHTSLKGHGGNIFGIHFSINGKYLATAADDRTVRLWSVKDFGVGNKCVRVNVDLDHAKCVQFSPDSRAFIVGLAQGNAVRVFRLGKKDDGTTLCTPLDEDFKEECKEELLNVGVGSTATGGSYVMTAYKDTTIIICSIRGEVLNTINTNLGSNNYACVSPCGRYVGASGWTPDVKVWEVVFTKTGEYKDVQRAFDLKGHKSSVWSFAFNNDSTRMLTISKAGVWRLFDTEIEYGKGQEPCLLRSGDINIADIPLSENFCLCALSFDGKVGAVATLNSFSVFSTNTGKVDECFKEVHSEIITSLSFDISGKYLVSAGDRHVRIFHNILGYKETIAELDEKIKKLPASATRERLENQRKTHKAALDKLL